MRDYADIIKLPRIDSTEIEEIEIVGKLSDYISRLDVIGCSEHFVTCCNCNFTYLPMSVDSEAICVECGGKL